MIVNKYHVILIFLIENFYSVLNQKDETINLFFPLS